MGESKENLKKSLKRLIKGSIMQFCSNMYILYCNKEEKK